MVVRGFEPVIMMNINICVSTSIHIISQARNIVFEIRWEQTYPNNLDDKKNEKKIANHEIRGVGVGWGWLFVFMQLQFYWLFPYFHFNFLHAPIKVGFGTSMIIQFLHVKLILQDKNNYL